MKTFGNLYKFFANSDRNKNSELDVKNYKNDKEELDAKNHDIVKKASPKSVSKVEEFKEVSELVERKVSSKKVTFNDEAQVFEYDPREEIKCSPGKNPKNPQSSANNILNSKDILNSK